MTFVLFLIFYFSTFNVFPFTKKRKSELNQICQVKENLTYLNQGPISKPVGLSNVEDFATY